MVQMLFQYQIKEHFHVQYKEIMNDMIQTMQSYGASLALWDEHEKNKFIEVYSVPTEAYYYALKKKRQSSEIFLQCLEDPEQQIECLAIKRNR
ncbi:hypothetical protein GCM10008967_34970 [Bacillus carboniphilus]|uniref:Uncharacterized protein n=1 Tax=Bacillus carboniphilus TaxID=86663 RepID=A0ABN0WM75_9BACI